jgi:hypothetical protein
MNTFIRRTSATLGLLAGLAFAPQLAAASTVSVVNANYTVGYTGASDYDVFAGATFMMPSADSGIANSTITSCCSFNAGEFGFSLSPVFFYGLPADTPVSTSLYGLSWIGDTPSSDPTQLHLVVALDSAFATGAVGKSFDDAFGGGFAEQDVINELLYVAGLDQDFGLPSSPYGGPQTNLLFDFGSYIHDAGGSITDGTNFTLVAFSDGQAVGRGTSGFTPLGAAVPEPGAWALALLGCGMTGAALRRRRLRMA